MRIGIYTQPLTTNYGGILQNYALQTVLKRLGHEVWTVDYYHYTWFDWFNRSIRVIVHKLLGHFEPWPLTPSEKKAKEIPLRRFVNSYITCTNPRTKWFENKTILKYKFDALIVGSDQVWRPSYNLHIEDLFFSFVKDVDLLRIAYAASFGTDSWEFSKKQTLKCLSLAKRFKAISVREKSGISLCKEFLDVNSEQVLDPTLLLSIDDYMSLISNVKKQEPFVFAYILDVCNEKINDIKEFAKHRNMPYLIMSAGQNITENDSIEKWLSYFRDASYIVTDSFHGTVFSVVFKKNFLVYGNKERGNSRFDSILTLLNLRDRIIENKIKLLPDIDFGTVYQILDRERAHSISWLKNNLEQ